MKDFSIVIPHRGSALGLWATVTSCEEELRRTSFDYDYVLVCNGNQKLESDAENVSVQLDKAGKLRECIRSVQPLSPPDARQLGSHSSDSRLLFFFDNHCLVTKDYFVRAVRDFEEVDVDLLHSTTQFYSDDVKNYEYRLRLEHNFWASSNPVAKDAVSPYRVAAGGHGGFAVRNSSWKQVGGYGPKGLFEGYGGEELYTDLKLWLLGKSVWIDPLLIHYHFAGERGYKRHYTDEYFTNMLICANVIGGCRWMYKVFESFITPGRFIKHKSEKLMIDLLMDAELRSADHAKELASQTTKTLDELLVWFSVNDIPF